MSEIWRGVPGFEGKYEVSDLGRVRSLTGSRGIRKKPRIKKTPPDKDGYLTASLCTGSAGKTAANRVNRLVLMAFDRLPVGSEEAAHNDGVKINNVLGNLRWATRSENEQDRRLHGTAQLGEDCYRATITNEQARCIKELIQKGTKSKDIAAEIGCSVHIVTNIKRGNSWQSVLLETK